MTQPSNPLRALGHEEPHAHGLAARQVEAQRGLAGVDEELVHELQDVRAVEARQPAPLALVAQPLDAQHGGEGASRRKGSATPASFSLRSKTTSSISSPRSSPGTVQAVDMSPSPGRPGSPAFAE